MHLCHLCHLCISLHSLRLGLLCLSAAQNGWIASDGESGAAKALSHVASNKRAFAAPKMLAYLAFCEAVPVSFPEFRACWRPCVVEEPQGAEDRACSNSALICFDMLFRCFNMSLRCFDMPLRCFDMFLGVFFLCVWDVLICLWLVFICFPDVLICFRNVLMGSKLYDLYD